MSNKKRKRIEQNKQIEIERESKRKRERKRVTSPSDNDNNTEAKNHRNDRMLNNRTERRSSISNEYYTFLLRWYNNGHIMMCLDARCETQEYRSYLLENSPFFCHHQIRRK